MPFCFGSLNENRQAVYTDPFGVTSTADGPGLHTWSCCTSVEERDALVLEEFDYVRIMNNADGQRRVVHGPGVEWLGPREQVLQGIEKCPVLTREEYIVVHDTMTGAMRNVVGPTLFKPGVFDEVSAKKVALNLAMNEYVKIKDETGKVRVERGQARIIPDPLEEVIGPGVVKGVNIDEHNAVKLRNEDTGTIELITDHGLFIPGPYQVILEVQKKIILEEHERMVYKDETGKFIHVSGDSQMRNFFLPPFCEVVAQEWSTDLKKEHKKFAKVWKFDVRPSYMKYEFNCRTIDNVELVVDVSFYWKIVDVMEMIQHTADAPGDVCTHARSMIIQAVSNITLMEFLESFNDIIRRGAGVAMSNPAEATRRWKQAEQSFEEKRAFLAERSREHSSLDRETASLETRNEADSALERAQQERDAAEKHLQAMELKAHTVPDTFYNERGIELLSVEVLQFSCSNPETDKTLQAIIKETADRLKKKECQKGENEVAISKLEGEIEQEKLNKKLLEIKKSHLKMEYRIEGEAEYHKVAAFVGGLSGQGADDIALEPAQAIEMYQMLRKLDSVRLLADSDSSLYVTPDDVNLTVGSLYPVPKLPKLTSPKSPRAAAAV